MDLIYIPFDQVNQIGLSGTGFFALLLCGAVEGMLFSKFKRVILVRDAFPVSSVPNYLRDNAWGAILVCLLTNKISKPLSDVKLLKSRVSSDSLLKMPRDQSADTSLHVLPS